MILGGHRVPSLVVGFKLLYHVGGVIGLKALDLDPNRQEVIWDVLLYLKTQQTLRS